jgi:hypothetical protein
VFLPFLHGDGIGEHFGRAMKIVVWIRSIAFRDLSTKTPSPLNFSSEVKNVLVQAALHIWKHIMRQHTRLFVSS